MATLDASNPCVHKLAVKLHVVVYRQACMQCAHIQYVGWHYNLLSKCQGGMRPPTYNIRYMRMCYAYARAAVLFCVCWKSVTDVLAACSLSPYGNQNIVVDIVFAGVQCRMGAQIYKCIQAMLPPKPVESGTHRGRHQRCAGVKPECAWWLLFVCKIKPPCRCSVFWVNSHGWQDSLKACDLQENSWKNTPCNCLHNNHL